MLADSESDDRFYAHEGELIGPKYRVIGMCGEGTFSNVYTCKEIKSHVTVVIKVCRSSKSFEEAAENEVEFMRFLQRIDPENRYFVKYYESFNYKQHKCIVLEKLGLSLYENLRWLKYKPFHTNIVRQIMRQVVRAVELLHKNEKVHTDLKLENILLRGNLIDEKGHDIKTNENGAYVKLVDFGSIDSEKVWHTHLATTRHYRAPEILLGLKWGYEADIWSLGCILVELAIGNIPFDSRDTLEHLFLIQYVIGKIPFEMWDRCTDKNIISKVRSGRLSSDVIFEENRESFLAKLPLREILSYNRDIASLACYILRPDPRDRPKAGEILRHPFFNA